MHGAEEYQLEWTYINNYGIDTTTYYNLSDLNVDFRHNSTRITTTGNSYRITLAFEKGYIAFTSPNKYLWSMELYSGLY